MIEIRVHGNRKVDPETSAFRAKATSIRASARHDGIDFSMSTEEVVDLIKKRCHYCGDAPSFPFKMKHKRPNKLPQFSLASEIVVMCNGLDRVHPGMGYIRDNVVPCCWICNRAKNTMPPWLFIAWIKRAATYQESRCASS